MNRQIPLHFILASFFLFSCSGDPYPDPLRPEASMKKFELHEDFVVELFAAEPHVQDPVELIFDENGTAYVVEMPDYPYKPEEGKGKGRIKILKDTNGDGQIDQSTVFAEGLPDATSMLAWKGGLIVTSAPHIYYLKDSNGDERADVKEIMFSGFFEHNSEAQITNLRFGIDNWIYAANNGQPGKVTSSSLPGASPLDMRGADFKFRLDKEKFELESGTAQFGQTFDDWGNKFITQNTLHIQQVIIPRRYLERHGHLSSLNVNANISDHDFAMFQLTPPPYWRAERTRRRNIQYQEQNLDRIEHADNYFTGASGGTIYLGDAFSEDFYGNIFTGDVAGNLVHRDILFPDPDSPLYIARRAEEEKNHEFLSSTDSWFRPVSFTVGPDGYLYIVDFYRQHIETPVSIPDDLKEDMDFMNGDKHGRIYRIKPKYDSSKSEIQADLRNRDSNEWITFLSHPNQWWRSNAHRLLLENPDTSRITGIREMASSHQDPRTRLRALYILESWNALEEELVKKALASDNIGLKKNALALAENFPGLQPDIALLTEDSSPQVVLQAVLSLGEFDNLNSVRTMANVLAQQGQNKWIRMAILSSDPGSDIRMIKILSEELLFNKQASWENDFIKEFAHILGSRGEKGQIKDFINLVGNQPNKSGQLAGLEGLSKGLKRHEKNNPRLKDTLENLSITEGEVEKAFQQLLASI